MFAVNHVVHLSRRLSLQLSSLIPNGFSFCTKHNLLFCSRFTFFVFGSALFLLFRIAETFPKQITKSNTTATPPPAHPRVSRSIHVLKPRASYFKYILDDLRVNIPTGFSCTVWWGNFSPSGVRNIFQNRFAVGATTDWLAG